MEAINFIHLISFYICSIITECNCFMGKLYVVPTPVGNLEDMTFRAIRVLKEADLILAEDTRTSGILLKHFEIKNAMQSHHKFNEHKTVEGIVNRIKAGETVALISDAGTPGISDPGFLIVRECVKNDIEVQCLPGATALYLRWWRRDCLMNVSVLKDSCHKKRKSDPFDFFTRRKTDDDIL